MPRWASRITLEVLDIQEQRLQETTVKDGPLLLDSHVILMTADRCQAHDS
jgi:hypothetical protein